jgi:hypothetical protein
MSPILLLVEYRAARPILPLSLFCERTKVTAMFANNLNWMGYSGSYMLLPIYLQEARGENSKNRMATNPDKTISWLPPIPLDKTIS